MNYQIEETDPWYVRHGALVGGLIVVGSVFGIFAWGMGMWWRGLHRWTSAPTLVSGSRHLLCARAAKRLGNGSNLA